MIIIEGIDGVGKTTLVDYFVNMGMRKYHFDYDVNNMDLFTKYMRVLSVETKYLVFDRSFISEMVYGPVLRNKCKLTIEQYTQLLIEYNNCHTSIIYLKEKKNVLLTIRSNDLKDFEMIKNYYELLNSKYDEIINYSGNYIDILKFDSCIFSKEEIQNRSKRLILK